MSDMYEQMLVMSDITEKLTKLCSEYIEELSQYKNIEEEENHLKEVVKWDDGRRDVEQTR